MSILDLTGNKIGDTTLPPSLEQLADTPQPEKHEPRWYRKRMQECDQQFAELFQQAIDDLNASQTPGTTSNPEAIVKHYAHAWAEFAHKVLKSPQPVPLKVTAMKEELDTAIENARLEALRKTSLARLTKEDLKANGLAFLGTCGHGNVYLSTEFAVVVADNEECRLYLRPYHTDFDVWCEDRLATIDCKNYPPDLVGLGYTLREINSVMAGLRRHQYTHPAEDQLKAAKGETA